MTESVSDILVARQREFDSVGRPVAFSFGVHVVVIAAMALLPAAWFGAKKNMPTMTISLGAGPLGVKRTGMIQTGGRKVDQAVETKEPIIPVAPPKPTTPDPQAVAVKTPPKVSDKPATTPTTTPTSKPAVGAKVTPGSAQVETGTKGVEIGLSSAGGGGTNSAEMMTCCKEYFNEMLTRIDAVWQRNQGAAGEVTIEFVIEKNGAITGARVAKPSGVDLLDLAALRAVTVLKLGALPSEYTGQRMFMVLKFPYIR